MFEVDQISLTLNETLSELPSGEILLSELLNPHKNVPRYSDSFSRYRTLAELLAYTDVLS